MARGLLQQLPFGRAKSTVDDNGARYASAMRAIEMLDAELRAVRGRDASAAERHRLHTRIDEELARAIESANAVYERRFAAAGGRHHGDTDPDVELWKRRLNNVLTIRSQHQLAEFDDAGALPPSTVRPPDRAAYGPHQAGMDFDIGQES